MVVISCSRTPSQLSRSTPVNRTFLQVEWSVESIIKSVTVYLTVPDTKVQAKLALDRGSHLSEVGTARKASIQGRSRDSTPRRVYAYKVRESKDSGHDRESSVTLKVKRMTWRNLLLSSWGERACSRLATMRRFMAQSATSSPTSLCCSGVRQAVFSS